MSKPRATAEVHPKARKTKAGAEGTLEPKLPPDWEAIEPLYRAGQKSLREIAKQFEISDTAIRLHAKAEGWQRLLADRCRKAVRERLLRADASQDGSHPLRANDCEVVEAASLAGFDVVMLHRKDIQQLNELKRTLATRLVQYLSGENVDGPCLGERESPGDLMEKLARTTARLIPLERLAFNLDEAPQGENPMAALFDMVDGTRWNAAAA